VIKDTEISADVPTAAKTGSITVTTLGSTGTGVIVELF
jgi:hypothetical protein